MKVEEQEEYSEYFLIEITELVILETPYREKNRGPSNKTSRPKKCLRIAGNGACHYCRLFAVEYESKYGFFVCNVSVKSWE